MSLQERKVSQFFDAIAEDYAGRYNSSDAYYRYYFNQRLEAATEGLDFEGKTILDIGAGTGQLFDLIKKKTAAFEYFACDISPAMLDKSTIPKSCRFAGTIFELPFKMQNFDFIFMLGLTTYIGKAEFKKMVPFLENKINPGGLFVISFTNRNSWDFKIRQGIHFFVKNKFFRKKIIGQSFKTEAFSLAEVEKIMRPHFEIKKKVWLNQTFFPLNRLFPRPSVFVAKIVKRNALFSKLLPFLSDDFLVFLER